MKGTLFGDQNTFSAVSHNTHRHARTEAEKVPHCTQTTHTYHAQTRIHPIIHTLHTHSTHITPHHITRTLQHKYMHGSRVCSSNNTTHTHLTPHHTTNMYAHMHRSQGGATQHTTHTQHTYHTHHKPYILHTHLTRHHTPQTAPQTPHHTKETIELGCSQHILLFEQ